MNPARSAVAHHAAFMQVLLWVVNSRSMRPYFMRSSIPSSIPKGRSSAAVGRHERGARPCHSEHILLMPLKNFRILALVKGEDLERRRGARHGQPLAADGNACAGAPRFDSAFQPSVADVPSLH